jgi:hypothetical protein
MLEALISEYRKKLYILYTSYHGNQSFLNATRLGIERYADG